MDVPATAAATTTGWTAPAAALPAWGPPLPSSSTIFTEEAKLRPRARTPERGWRHAVYALWAGVVILGPSRAEVDGGADVGAAASDCGAPSRTAGGAGTAGGRGPCW